MRKRDSVTTSKNTGCEQPANALESPMNRLSTLMLPILLIPLTQQTCGSAPTRSELLLEQLVLYHQPFIDRGQADEVAEKYQLLAGSPLTFFRGTAFIFFWDAARDESLNSSAYLGDSLGDVWLQGDLHIGNLGVLSTDADLQFYDLNDMDEAALGPWLWDIRRLATSHYLTALELGLSTSKADEVLSRSLLAYVEALAQFSGSDDELDEQLTADTARGEIQELLEKAAQQSQLALLEQYTDGAGGFTSAGGDLQPVSASLFQATQEQMPLFVASLPQEVRKSSSYYNIKDMARRLNAGVGSLPAYRYYVLLEGKSTDDDDDRILDLKEARESSVTQNFETSSLPTSTEAERQLYAMTRAWQDCRELLGTMTLEGMHFRVVERHAEKADLDLEGEIGDDAGKLKTVVEQQSWLAARFLARLDEDLAAETVPFDADGAVWSVVARDPDGFVAETRAFAQTYAAQVQTDFEIFVEALADDPLLGAQAGVR